MGSTAYSETYTYNDSDGSLNTMTTGVGTTLTMGYDGLRRLTSVTGGPFNRSYAYRDISGTATTLQVSQLSYPNLGSGVSFGYTYDNLGNIATYTAPDGEVITYSYDNQGQLLKAEGDATYLYVYDSVGNILSANGHTYSYGNANWKDLLTAFDGNSITYDASGNPTSYYNGTCWTMTWANGRSLATASDGTTSLSFTYDASGLRTSKTVGSTTYRYYYAGGKLMRMTWGGNTIDFFYDESGLPYAMKHNGTVYYYVTNLQGDVMRVVNASGTVVASYDYDPYGKVLSATGTLANVNPLRYRAYVYDQETGLYYVSGRYYDPEIGRWINADALVDQSSVLGYNLFAYCCNNPVNMADTTGNLPFFAITAVIGAVVGAVIGGVVAAKSGGNVWAGIGIGAAAGALIGTGAGMAAGAALAGSITATTGAVMAGGSTLVATVGSGGLGAGAAYIANNLSQAANNLAPAAQTAASKMHDVAAKGKAGEVLSGLTKNTSRISSLTCTAHYRIPDGLDCSMKILSEVKNYSGTLSYTNQLKDFVMWSQAEGYQMHLYTNAKLSGPLQQVVDSGLIQLFPLG